MKQYIAFGNLFFIQLLQIQVFHLNKTYLPGLNADSVVKSLHLYQSQNSQFGAKC